MLELDRRGLPAVAVFSEEFETGVVAWRNLYGFDAGAVYVRHPIQPLNDDEVKGRAGVEQIVERLGGERLPRATVDAIIARADGSYNFV